jgi:hypothetical protein
VDGLAGALAIACLKGLSLRGQCRRVGAARTWQAGGDRQAFELLVPAAGVEPATFRSGGERSNPLSYAGLKKIAGLKELDKKCTPFCTPRQYRAAFGTGLL